MNEKVLKTLEFNKIIDRLKELAGSTIGKEKCADLKPVSDLEEIQTLQAETAAALNRIYRKGSLSFPGYMISEHPSSDWRSDRLWGWVKSCI